MVKKSRSRSRTEKEHLVVVTEIVVVETVEVVDETLVAVTEVDETLVVVAVIVAGNRKKQTFFGVFFGISRAFTYKCVIILSQSDPLLNRPFLLCFVGSFIAMDDFIKTISH